MIRRIGDTLDGHGRDLTTGNEGASVMPRQIMVVEDDALNMRLFHDLLESRGYETIEAGDGRTALDLARRHTPDLILTDVQLPQMSGIELIRRIKSDARLSSVPVIAVSAFANEGEKERIRDSGCDACVTKPFSIDNLLDVIENNIRPDSDERIPQDKSTGLVAIGEDRNDTHEVESAAAEVARTEVVAAAEPATKDAGRRRTAAKRLRAARKPPADTVAATTGAAVHEVAPSSGLTPMSGGAMPGGGKTNEGHDARAAVEHAPPHAIGAALLFAVTFLGGALWPVPVRIGRGADLYLADFPGGAADLIVGSPVRYGGAEIGQVVRVESSGADRSILRAVLDIDRGATIYDDLVAHLRHEIIVGKAFIELRRPTYAGIALKSRVDRSIGPIRPVQAEMERAIADLPRLIARTASMIQVAASLTDEPDTRALSRSLGELGALATSMARTHERSDALLADGEIALGALRSAADKIEGMAGNLEAETKESPRSARDTFDKIGGTLGELNRATKALARGADNLSGLIAEHRAPIRELDARWREDVTALLSELRDVAAYLRQSLGRTAEAQPTATADGAKHGRG